MMRNNWNWKYIPDYETDWIGLKLDLESFSVTGSFYIKDGNFTKHEPKLNMK